MHLLYYTGGGGPGGQTGEQTVIGQLGLTKRQLGLLKGGLGIPRIQLIEQRPLFNAVSHLKRSLQNFSAGQGADLIGFNGGHCTRAVDRDGKVLE